ncbi:MAG: single-stranded-DNA-specific exonuclease RecJ [Plesiomonas sp.]|uniref:single-stranded-DNA-specific exonuclease RecJ n=1 Tax=Plesiomonas sp. TaxID=2486279 RepID=UPI003F300C7C
MNTEICRRPQVDDSHLAEVFPPFLRQIYARRGVSALQQLDRSIKHLLDYRQLQGIEQATQLLQQAIYADRQITIVGDFDADGATSTALSVLALRSLGARRVNFLVPNRFEDGYGLSPEVVIQAQALGAELIMTVDNGISSHSGVQEAHARGIQVLITDHHLQGTTLPDADAIVNPNLHSCHFPSKALAGVGVAFYLMLALRAALRTDNWFSRQEINEPNLAELLDLVALGSVADVVPLDANNRLLIWQGLNRIRAGRCRPGILALLEVANRDPRQLVASDLGFALGPRLNAAGRLDNMSIGVTLLLCEEMSVAREIACDLDVLNQTRREIEQGMQQEALNLCQKLDQDHNLLPCGLALFHPEWHQGVVGILASRIKERFHRPVIAFAPAGDGILKGSGRSIVGLHMRDALERLDSQNPGLIQRFGGHAMAAGLSIDEAQFSRFQHCFANIVTEWLDESALQGKIWSDGELPTALMTIETAEMLRQAGPWGQGFNEPLFDGEFTLLQQRKVGDKHLKMLLEPIAGGPMLDAIAFNVDTTLWPDPTVRQVRLAYRLEINEFRGNRNVQLLVEHIDAL